MRSGANRGEVARLARVAESTVSRALCDSSLISPLVKKRVRLAAEKLGYVPNRQAALFARRQTLRLGFVVRSYTSFPPFSRAYFPALLDGAVMGADERGYFLTIILDRKGQEVRDLAQTVQSKEVDGLLISIIQTQDPRIEGLMARKIPFVIINDHQDDCFSVDHNPSVGMSKAFEHAVSLGHSHIGYITGDLSYRNARDRMDAFQNQALKFGVYTRIEEADFSRTGGYRSAGRLLCGGEPPTLIMTASDREALGVIDYCKDHGIRVPEDVSLVGYDNLLPAQDVSPRLTTVDNPVTREGYAAAQLLIDVLEKKIARPVCKWLDTGFVVRQSTGPAKK
jgi:LacI family transcriptional regulator